MTKTIQFLGKERQVAFNMAAQIAFEALAGKPFSLQEIGTSVEQQVALYYACILAADKATDLTIENLLNDATFEDIHSIDMAIGEMMTEFYHIPATVPEDSPSGDTDEEESPNH